MKCKAQGNGRRYAAFFQKKGVKMIEYLFAILLFFTLSVSLGFVAGCLAGRALERVEVEQFIDKYYEIGSEDK